MEINFLAVVVAALVPTVLGFIWYHPKVFGNVWMVAAGMDEEKIKSGNMPVIFGLSLLFSLMLAWAMNLLAHHDAFVGGALYYVTNGTMDVDPASDAGKWLEFYKTNLSATCRNFKHGAFHGGMIGGLFMALPILATNGLFERKGGKYIAVNAGYWIITLAIMGGIIAAWK